jgi:peroxiredoxin
MARGAGSSGMGTRAALAAVLLAGACGDGGPPAKGGDVAEAKAAPVAATAPAPSETMRSATPDEQAAATALVGTTPPEWRAERWLNTAPLALADLRGSVVLVRWWTSGCPWCAATAPALRAFHQTYAERGLKVVGMYHHKEETPFEPKVYEDTAKEYGFTFPVAFDPEWHTLDAWRHDKDGKAVDTGWTSITFVLDKKGVVRHVHPGGEYVEGQSPHTELRAVIEKLLAED